MVLSLRPPTPKMRTEIHFILLSFRSLSKPSPKMIFSQSLKRLLKLSPSPSQPYLKPQRTLSPLSLPYLLEKNQMSTTLEFSRLKSRKTSQWKYASSSCWSCLAHSVCYTCTTVCSSTRKKTNKTSQPCKSIKTLISKSFEFLAGQLDEGYPAFQQRSRRTVVLEEPDLAPPMLWKAFNYV
jgi:hypothetical protein